MNSRQSLALVVALLGVYLLIHAAMAGYALYSAHLALRPSVIDGPYLAELRDNKPTLIVLFVAVFTLGLLSMTACVGFLRNSNWAGRLWLVTSAAVAVCLILAMVFLEVIWTHYHFELAAISMSWVLYALHLRNARDEA
jgi:hypothetical protein